VRAVLCCNVSPWNTDIEKLIIAQIVNRSLAVMDLEGLLPRSQQPATGHFPEPDESNPHPQTQHL
jgi:hypothetical protein